MWLLQSREPPSQGALLPSALPFRSTLDSVPPSPSSRPEHLPPNLPALRLFLGSAQSTGFMPADGMPELPLAHVGQVCPLPAPGETPRPPALARSAGLCPQRLQRTRACVGGAFPEGETVRGTSLLKAEQPGLSRGRPSRQVCLGPLIIWGGRGYIYR